MYAQLRKYHFSVTFVFRKQYENNVKFGYNVIN